MKRGGRIYFSATQQAEIWDRWQAMSTARLMEEPDVRVPINLKFRRVERLDQLLNNRSQESVVSQQ